MRLKCNDGKVREFTLPWTNNINEEMEAQCLECGKYFGIHDTKILKPRFKEHTCGNEDKYYELMRYANNPVGADFAYCTEEQLENLKKSFNPDTIDEISKEQYEIELERQHRRGLRFATGYPK